MAESLAEKKARGGQPPDSFCCRAAPMCVLEASVTSDTSADGKGCVRDTAEERADLALSKVMGFCGPELYHVMGKMMWLTLWLGVDQ